MKKYGIIINMINNAIAFWPGYCTYTRVFSPISLDQATLLTEVMPTKIIKDITPNKIIKKGFQENVNDFLKIPDKISKSQKKPINKAKWKLNMGNTSPKNGHY